LIHTSIQHCWHGIQGRCTDAAALLYVCAALHCSWQQPSQPHGVCMYDPRGATRLAQRPAPLQDRSPSPIEEKLQQHTIRGHCKQPPHASRQRHVPRTYVCRHNNPQGPAAQAAKSADRAERPGATCPLLQVAQQRGLVPPAHPYWLLSTWAPDTNACAGSPPVWVEQYTHHLPATRGHSRRGEATQKGGHRPRCCLGTQVGSMQCVFWRLLCNEWHINPTRAPSNPTVLMKGILWQRCCSAPGPQKGQQAQPTMVTNHTTSHTRQGSRVQAGRVPAPISAAVIAKTGAATAHSSHRNVVLLAVAPTHRQERGPWDDDMF
jgi:hypothetical protein